MNVKKNSQMWDRISSKYSGPIRLAEKEFVNLGSGRTIFVCSGNDLFADDVPKSIIMKIIEHCDKYPENTYLFQSKNPLRIRDFMFYLPPKRIIGTTIETNRYMQYISNAPPPIRRIQAMIGFRTTGEKIMLSLEPILDFDVTQLFNLIRRIRPDFISIGADSKHNNLPEPSPDKIRRLYCELKRICDDIRLKRNLNRIISVDELG